MTSLFSLQPAALFLEPHAARTAAAKMDYLYYNEWENLRFRCAACGPILSFPPVSGKEGEYLDDNVCIVFDIIPSLLFKVHGQFILSFLNKGFKELNNVSSAKYSLVLSVVVEDDFRSLSQPGNEAAP